MRVIVLWALLALSVSVNAQDNLSDCLSIEGIGSKIIDTNSTFSTVSWQTAVANRCQSSVRADFAYKIFDSDGFELDSQRVYDFYLPTKETTIVTSAVLVDPANASAMATNTIEFTKAEPTTAAILGDTDNCLSVKSLGSIILDTNETFQERSWKSEISNSCPTAFDLRIEFRFYDDEYFELERETVYDAYIPGNGSIAVNDIALISPASLASRIGFQSARVARAEETELGPRRQTSTRWNESALSQFKDTSGRLQTNVHADGIGTFALELALQPHPSEILFTLDESSLVPLTFVPTGAARFLPVENTLVVPAASVELNGQVSIFEKLSFSLIDPQRWLFRLDSFTDLSFQSRELRGAGNCLTITGQDSRILDENDTYAEISWQAEITNHCNQAFSIDIRFSPYTDDGYMIDEDTKYRVSVPASETINVTDRFLLSPSEKVGAMAKQLLSIEVN